MRWSQLKKLLAAHFDPELALDVHCAVRRTPAGDVAAYHFVLDKETIWSAPPPPGSGEDPTASDLTAVMRDYLATAKEELLTKRFEGDHWGLTEVLRAADRRVGRRRLPELLESTYHPAARLLIERRIRGGRADGPA